MKTHRKSIERMIQNCIENERMTIHQITILENDINRIDVDMVGDMDYISYLLEGNHIQIELKDNVYVFNGFTNLSGCKYLFPSVYDDNGEYILINGKVCGN